MTDIIMKDYTLGIDIGGTHTAMAVVDTEGNILCRATIKTTDFATFPKFVDGAAKALKKSVKEAGIDFRNVRSIGIGAPCVNVDTGMVEGAVDLPWPSPIPLKDDFSEKFGLPVGVANDANAAALGEMFYGECAHTDDFIMITLGTGVGSAIVTDGNLLQGRKGFAGELGHTFSRRHHDRLCSCGRYGCLETYCSARGVVKTALDFLDTPRHSSLKQIDPAKLTAKDVCMAAEAGDEVALATLRLTGEVLGEACADFAAFSSPETIVLFGGVANAFPYFIDSMKEAFERNLLWIYKDSIRIVKSGLPESDAALLGAAAVGRSAFLRQRKENRQI